MAKFCCGDRSEDKRAVGDMEDAKWKYTRLRRPQLFHSLPTAEEEQLDKLGGELTFSSDTYDACYVSILRFFSKPQSKKYAGLSLLVTLVLHIGCILLQTSALFLLIAFAIEQKQDPYESENLPYGEQMLRNASVANKTLDSTLSFVKLCLHDHSVPYTAYGFTWIWTIKLLPAFLHTVFFCVLTCSLDHKYDGEPIVPSEKSPNKDAIVSASHRAKFLTTFIVTLPRVFVTAYMWWAGTKFLAYADSLETLVMKCVSLAFVLQFPEFLFKAFVHRVVAESVSRATLRYDDERTVGNVLAKLEHEAEMKIAERQGRTQELEDDHSELTKSGGLYENYSHWKVWGHPVFLALSSSFLSFIVRYVRFEDVITFRAACHDYKEGVLGARCEGDECGSFYFGYHFYS